MRKLNPLLIFVLISLIVFGCRTNDEMPETLTNEGSATFLLPEQIPGVMNRLNEKFNLGSRPSAGANEDVTSSIGTIHLDKIFEVIDTLGNANYTFLVDDEDDNPYNFTNLIIKKREGGLIDEPYLLEYTPDSSFVQEFIESGFAMDQFTGKIRKRYLMDFSVGGGNNANLLEGANSYLDGAPCDEETSYSKGVAISSGSGGGDSGDVDSGGDLDTSGDPDFVCTDYLEPVRVRTRWKDGSCCDSHIEFKRITVCEFVNPSNGANDDDNCPDPESEEIGVLMPEILFDPSFIGTKAECVYKKLSASSDGFRNAIKKFDGEFPVAHLRFTTRKDLGPSVAARTYLPAGNTDTPDYVITIGINGGNSQAGQNFRPELMIAKTLVHEVIHAEMYRKLLSLIREGKVEGLTASELNRLLANGDFPGIYDYYRRFGRDFQHEQMAQHYVQIIADIAKMYDNSRHSSQFYKDIAWEGLKGTTAWDDLLTIEQTRITNTINNFIILNHNDVCK